MVKRERITSNHVAKQAGVSQATVSRALSGKGGVSEDVVMRVREAADLLGYRPNSLARSLITGSTRTIGLVVAYLDNPFYADALEKFSRHLQEQGYHLMVYLHANQQDDVDAVIHDLADKQVDAMILASVSLTNTLAQALADRNIPVVMFNRRQMSMHSSPSVTSANRQGGALVADYLVDQGYERIAHISGWLGSSTGVERQAGFVDQLCQRGHKLFAQADSHFNRETCLSVTRAMFGQDQKPDAVFVGNDHMAITVMDCLRSELGLRVPEDVAVVGYDDVPQAAWPSYDLTTVRQPANRMVGATCDMLLAMIKGETFSEPQVEIAGELQKRSSA